MRHAALALLALSLVMGMPRLALAQVNVLPEPNVLTPGHDTPWLTQVETAKTEPTPDAGASVLQLCTAHMARWPEPLRKACVELLVGAIGAEHHRLQAEIETNRTVFRTEHTQATLRDQRRQSAWVFWMVVAVVGVGLLAAVAQFMRSWRVPDAGGSAELAVSNNEFRFKTTWLGALLLGMSMGFLALYLFFVYPVRYVGG